MAIKRKITFHEVKFSDPDVDVAHLLREVFAAVQSRGRNPATRLVFDLSAIHASLSVEVGNTGDITPRTSRLYGKAFFVRYNELPETFQRSTGVATSLADVTPDDVGITEEAHFVIDLQYRRPIMAVETVRSGPKIGNILAYFEWWLRGNGYRFEVTSEPILGRSAQQLIAALSECATLEIKAVKEKIPDIRRHYQGLGSSLMAVQEIAHTDFVILILGYKFDVRRVDRPDTTELKREVARLEQINREHPGFFDNFESIEIRAQEGERPLQLYDLIADRTAAEVNARKRSSRSKHYNSHEFYGEIETSIRRNFGSPAYAADAAP
ncbi:MAG: hypothetical protein ACK4Q5_16565 [Saprospiraceae bacterium]